MTKAPKKSKTEVVKWVICSMDDFDVITEDGDHIATTQNNDHARLIAAAPEMLGLLEKFADLFTSDRCKANAAKHARGLLAKIRGEK